MEKRKVAVFDIDGTVFRSSLFLELVEQLFKRNIFTESTSRSVRDRYEAWRNRKGTYEAYVDKAVEIFNDSIKGVAYADVADIAGEIIEEQRHHVYRYTRELLQKLRKQGYFILGISHSPKFIVDGFGYEHGFDKTYGYFFTTGPSGNFTGLVEEREVMANKAAVLERAVRKEQLTLEDSVGVGDTESDIPMLELVTHPIAFNPNKKLFDHAKRRGWKVVVERKDVIYEL